MVESDVSQPLKLNDDKECYEMDVSSNLPIGEEIREEKTSFGSGELERKQVEKNETSMNNNELPQANTDNAPKTPKDTYFVEMPETCEEKEVKNDKTKNKTNNLTQQHTQNENFKEIPLEYPFAINCSHGIQILPGTQDMDGFYYCLLTKTN